MKRQTLVCTLLTIVLTTGILQAEEKAQQELSNTRFARTSLRITTDPKTFSIGFTEDDTERLSDIMHSPEILQAAAKEVLETSDVYGREQFFHSIKDIPSQIDGFQVIQVELSVALKETHKPAAKEFLEAYIEKLKAVLIKEYKFSHGLYADKLGVYHVRREQAESHLNELLHKQANLGGGGTLDKESVRQRIWEHEKAMIENDMQQAILKIRAKELSKQVSEVHHNTLKRVEKLGSEIKEISDLIDQCRAEYKALESERNQLAKSNPKSEEKIQILSQQLDETEGKYSTLTTEKSHLKSLIGTLQQQLETQSSEEIQELNRQLREATMQLEELKIQEAVLAGSSPGSLGNSIQYEMLEVKIEAAKENLRHALIEQDQATLQCDLLQPPTLKYDKIIAFETVAESD